MGAVLGRNRYGKSGIRLVRVFRDGDRPELVDLPNKHHLPVDLTPYGLRNAGEVFVATDRPFGLIEGTVAREGVPPAAGWA
jgi:hypothetical protein